MLDQYIAQSWDSEAIEIKARLQIVEVIFIGHGDDDEWMIERSGFVSSNRNDDDSNSDGDDVIRRSPAQEKEREKE